jgi:hypothetical protein
MPARIGSQVAPAGCGAAVYDEAGLLIMAVTGDAGVPGPDADGPVGMAPGYQA